MLSALLTISDVSGAKAPRNKRAGKPDEAKELEPTKVFVTSLAWEVTDAEMVAFFNAHCGDDSVVKAEVLVKRSGRSMGSGIVEFRTAAHAQAALQLAGESIGSRAIAVREYFKDN